MRLCLHPSGPLRGTLRVPGDKSITHRALVLAAWAHGESAIRGANPGLDCIHLARALGALGAGVRRIGTWPATRGPGAPASAGAHASAGEAPAYAVRGVGGTWREPACVLRLGNSATALRLLAGAVAGQDLFCVLDGDESLRRRPMARVSEPLRRMGAHIDGRGAGAHAPLAVRGGALRGIHHVSPVASAQVKSALLLAGLVAEGETRVTEPRPSRDHTERLLPLFGAVPLPLPAGDPSTGHATAVAGPQRLRAAEVEVPGDLSAAAYWIVAALVVPGSEVTIEGVGLNPTRAGLVRALARMGAAIETETTAERSGEPVGNLRVVHSPLRGIRLDADDVPAMIDEVPAWAVACAFAEGASTLSGAAELRAKESDRLRGIARGLAALGARVEEREDGLVIQGAGPATTTGGGLRGGRASAAGDHRLAMAFLAAGLASREGVEVTGCEMVDTSYPGFYPTALALASYR